MRFTLAALAALICAGPAFADRYRLEFDGGAYGVIPLGRATLDISVEDGRYRAAATIRSEGLAALFDRTDLSASADGTVAAGRVNWGRYGLDHSYARKRRIVAIVNGGGGPEVLATPSFGFPGDPAPTPEQKRQGRDPLSAIVSMAVQVAETGRCDGTTRVFDGRYIYDLSLRREGEDRHRGGGYDGRVLKCKMRQVRIAGYRVPSDLKKRLPEGEIWFALDTGAAFAPPVRVSAPLPLGHATIRLAKMQKASVAVTEAGAP
jgi:hypothetical protein